MGGTKQHDGAMTDSTPAAASADPFLEAIGRVHDLDISVENAAPRNIARVFLYVWMIAAPALPNGAFDAHKNIRAYAASMIFER